MNIACIKKIIPHYCSLLYTTVSAVPAIHCIPASSATAPDIQILDIDVVAAISHLCSAALPTSNSTVLDRAARCSAHAKGSCCPAMTSPQRHPLPPGSGWRRCGAFEVEVATRGGACGRVEVRDGEFDEEALERGGPF
jgi:hypothetical protein